MRLTVLLGLLFCSLYAYTASERQEISARIQPVGQVLVQAQKKPKKHVAPRKGLGRTTYERYCTVCHQSGLAGAPKFRNEDDWKPRLVDRTLNDLVESSKKGLRAMPVKGTCVECSDDDLKAAISYMLPKS